TPAGTAFMYHVPLVSASGSIGYAIAVDPAGSAYVAGTTSSPDFPVTGSAFMPVNPAGTPKAFLTKLGPGGPFPLAYSTCLGGSVDDFAYGLAVDPAGNAYLTGGTESPDFPLVGAFQSGYAGGLTDAFVAKINTMLFGPPSLVYSSYLGGSDMDAGYAV